MAKTANSYVPDQGEVQVVISAANVTAIAAFTTAETITIDGAVRSFRRTNDPQRPYESTRVTGDVDPIVSVGDTVEAETWELVLLDDYSEGAAGEWGTDLLSAYEIFWEFWKARASTEIGGLKVTPAGGATGDIQYTLTSPRILAVGVPVTDADQTAPNEVRVLIAAEGHTAAAHA